MNDKSGYIQIKPEYFLKGMYVDSDVFYILNSKPVLFCKQAVITDEKLVKLRAIAESGAPIYVSSISYNSLKKQYERFMKDGKRQEEQFREAEAEFADIYQFIKENGTIEINQVNKLVGMVNESVEAAELSFILQWISYMRDADEYLYTHSVNVGVLNGMIGKWLELSAEESEKLVLIGLLHDVGKTKIAEAILNKPGKLTEEEFNEIKKHPLFSYEILSNSGITDMEILNGVKEHHEKGNGSGYPDGLRLDKISLFGKITAISDIYDAMVAKRVYKEAKTPFEVLDEFYRNKFSDLDIRLVDLFLDRMAVELVGKDIILSNGKMAKLVFVEKSNFAYPIVQCDGNVINTSKELRCETLCLDMS